MKLDRNITRPRRGKYALIKLREAKLPFKLIKPAHKECFAFVPVRLIDYGKNAADFFVIRLKDKYAAPALRAYAKAAQDDDPEYAAEVFQLAINANAHPAKRKPD